jgi:adenylate cyclase
MSSLDIVPREESERRLAAILVADVVGYSRLMQADEEGTLARMEEIGANIVDPRVAAHRGRIFRTMGDGLLIEFPSVVEALSCAAGPTPLMLSMNSTWISAETGRRE